MDQHTLHPPPPPAGTVRPPARRSTTDRVLGGVSTAAARYLGISLTLTRVVFVVAGVVGGLGLVVYAVLWLFVPDDRERVLIQGHAASSTESIVAALSSGLASLCLSTWITRDGPAWLASMLVTAGVFVLSRRGQEPASGTPAPPAPGGDTPPTFTTPPPPPTPPPGPLGPQESEITGVLPLSPERPPVFPRAAPGPRSAPQPATPPAPKPPKPTPFIGPLTVSVAVAVAGSLAILDAIGAIDLQPSEVLIAALVVVGLGLLVSTWVGRARGLIVLGLLLVPVVGVSAVVDRIDLRGGFGDASWEPRTVAQLRDRYRLGAGAMQLDLTELDLDTLPAGQRDLSTTLSIGAGQVTLIVPEDWSLEVVSDVDIGAVWLYSGGTLVPEGRVTEELGPGQTRWDLDSTDTWYFPDREKVPSDADDDSGDRHTVAVTGTEGSPVLDVDVEVTAGVVEVLRVQA